jgi:hypothetical protein
MNMQLRNVDMRVLSDTSNNNAKVSKNAKLSVSLEPTKLLFLKNLLQTTNI